MKKMYVWLLALMMIGTLCGCSAAKVSGPAPGTELKTFYDTELLENAKAEKPESAKKTTKKAAE